MRKITKEQQTAIDAGVAACVTARDNINTLVEEYNTFLDEWNGKMQEAIEGYNSEVGDLREVYEGIAEQAQEYFDERSETWQEGDKGSTYNDWISALENPDVDDLDIDLPDPIDDPAFPDWDDAESWLPPSSPEGE